VGKGDFLEGKAVAPHNAVPKLRNEWRSTSILGYEYTSGHPDTVIQLDAADGTLYTCIQEMLGSNLGGETSYRECDLSLSSSSLQANAWTKPG
jgi:hypothetical protein